MVSYAVKFKDVNHFRYYTDPDFISFIRDVIANTTELIGFNVKFDIHWLQRYGILPRAECKIFDCSLAEFILSGQQLGMISLNEALESYGLPTKKDAVSEFWKAGVDTKDIPVDILREYNLWDVECTELLYKHQLQALEPKQIRLTLAEGEDLQVLAHAERAGIKWDKENADKHTEQLERDLADIEGELSTYLPPIPAGCVFNWDSGDQLSALLYGGVINYEYAIPFESVYKSGPRKGEPYTGNKWFEQLVLFHQRFKPLEKTEVAKTAKQEAPRCRFYQVDEPTLKQLKTRDKASRRLLDFLHERSKKIKVVEMIKSINKRFEEKNWQDGCIHPAYNQNIVITGRLSSSGPNMQNTPPDIDKFLVSRYA